MPEPFVVLFIAGILVCASIVTSRLSDWLGIPALVIFLAIGMLAGSDGPGGIHFDNAEAANFFGTVALAFILFSGGLDTNWLVIRPVLARGVILSTLGVAVTAVLQGFFAWSVLGFPILAALLLGAIVSSTDAAAVFSVLRGKGVGLKGNLKPLLELESGSNDPMAVFLTLGMTQLLTQPDVTWPALIPAFFINMAAGVAIGIGLGKIAGALFNRIRLDYEGLYPVLSTALVLITFGATEMVGGNGFLAVYLCGIVLNGTEFAHKRFVVKFHDGLGWLMQIAMFLVLGLLVFPSQLPAVAGQSLLAALFLMFVARPIAVAIGLLGSPYSGKERILVAWTGLRGAVPIVLATFPLMAGYEHSDLIFDVVFFTVLLSVLVQGTLLMPVARWLKVDEPLAARPRFSVEIQGQGQTQGATREIEVQPGMCAAGKTIADLGIPPDVLILLIGRGDGYVVPRGQTRVEPYDSLLMIGRPDALDTATNALYAPAPPPVRQTAPSDPLASLPMSVPSAELTGHAVVVGYGRVGRRICQSLREQGIRVVVVDEDRAKIESLRETGIHAVVGDATLPMVQAQAHVTRAAVLLIATPDTMKVRQMAETARALNPTIAIAVRSHSEMEAHLLQQEQAGHVFLGEKALADEMALWAGQQLKPGGGPPAH